MVADSLQTVQQGQWGLANVLVNHGFSITLSGMLVVFLGLSLIALTISIFNLVSKRLRERSEEGAPRPESSEPLPTAKGPAIPVEHLIAIGTAVELYRRLHLEPLNSRVTFEQGEVHTPWKTGFKYGQRTTPRVER